MNNIWFFIAIAGAIFLLLTHYRKNREIEQIEKWKTHPIRSKILNETISIINQEIARNLHPLNPNESYSVGIYIYSYGCEIGIDWISHEPTRIPGGGGYCLNSKMKIRFKEAGYQNITSTQMHTLGESLMRGLKDQFAADSEILISNTSYYSSTLEYDVTKVSVNLSKKCKRLKRVEI